MPFSGGVGEGSQGLVNGEGYLFGLGRTDLSCWPFWDGSGGETSRGGKGHARSFGPPHMGWAELTSALVEELRCLGRLMLAMQRYVREELR